MKKKLFSKLARKIRASSEGLCLYEILEILGYRPSQVIKFSAWIEDTAGLYLEVDQSPLSPKEQVYDATLIWDTSTRKFYWRGFDYSGQNYAETIVRMTNKLFLV